MVTRRDALRISISAFPIALAGCLGTAFTSSNGSPTKDPTQSPSPTPEPFDPLDYVDEWHEEPVRAEGEPLDVERTVDPDSADPPTCGGVASWEALQAARERPGELGRMTKGIGSFDHPEYDRKITISRQFIVRYRDHSVREKPTVEYDTLLNVTPRTVRATLVSENDTETCEYPVFIEDVVAWVGG